ncbi:MAG: hypothetical protein E5V75_15800 [Mesorhizobium sp.]|nr:MAG: hypothetical protein E5V75_15800 [Mesorhizobium sp.]
MHALDAARDNEDNSQASRGAPSSPSNRWCSAWWLLWPPANIIFQFGPPGLSDLAVVLATAIGFVALLEFLKYRWAGRLSV